MNEAFLRCRRKNGRGFSTRRWRRSQSTNTKKASTDDIAAKAGISKGLLFYYFHNKKELYLYLLEYATRRCAGLPKRPTCGRRRISLRCWKRGAGKDGDSGQNPYLLDFTVRSFYSSQEEISQAVAASYQQKVGSAFPDYFSHIDFLNSGRVLTRPTCSACSPG